MEGIQFRFLGNSGLRVSAVGRPHVLEDISAACHDAKVICDMQVKVDFTGGSHPETAET